jgi:diguanylate cyclase (GGDEF)-like protein
MNAAHISIRLTWCLVPFLSLLFSESRVYIGTSVFNYLIMALSTWLEAPHYAEIRTDFSSPLMGFINIFAGCTIEAVIIFASGLALEKATSNYYRSMLTQYAEGQEQQKAMQEQLNILNSMAEIYDYVNLIDFNDSSEMSLRGSKLNKLTIEPGQDHTHMTQGLKSQISADMVDDFWKFTDITTVPLRLVNRKNIVGEFVNNNSEWFRAQYIRVSGDIDKKPDVVIYTIQNIDADKRREEHLIRISMTDELTRLYNRRCYEEDIAAVHARPDDGNLALISADVNGLKAVNDNQGHAAGDELLRGAAFCLLSALGSYGRVYRTGGDEFMAIVNADDCAALAEDVKNKASAWHGRLVDGVSISVGYASRTEFPQAAVEELEKLADKRMYEAKAKHYQESGVDRRKR